MDIDFSERLKGFEDVWRRVQQQKAGKSPAPQKPTQGRPRSRASRFDPGRR